MEDRSRRGFPKHTRGRLGHDEPLGSVERVSLQERIDRWVSRGLAWFVRKLMERAKGILQQKHGITEEDAYLRLRNQSRRLRRPIREMAEAIILTEELNRQGKGLDSAE